MVNGCPFLVQVTVVAGDPVEMQANELEDAKVKFVMVGGTGGEKG